MMYSYLERLLYKKQLIIDRLSRKIQKLKEENRKLKSLLDED